MSKINWVLFTGVVDVLTTDPLQRGARENIFLVDINEHHILSAHEVQSIQSIPTRAGYHVEWRKWLSRETAALTTENSRQKVIITDVEN